MAKTAGLGDRLYVNGLNVSGDVGSIQTLSHTVGEQIVTGIDKSAVERIQTLHDGEIAFNNWFSDSASGVQENLQGLGTLAVITYLRGTSTGGYGAGMVAKQFQSQWQRSQDGSLLGTINAKAAGGTPLEWGFILDAAGFSDDDSGEDGAAYDLGASHGIDDMAFYIHVVDFDGTNATVLIEMDTADTFGSPTTYGTFATVTGVTSQRLAVAGAPERYIRWSVSGTYTDITFVIVAVPLFD